MMTIGNFPQLEWLKRLPPALKRLLGAAGAAMCGKPCKGQEARIKTFGSDFTGFTWFGF
jgi:hypothetical protein